MTTSVWVGLLFAALTILAAAAFQASPVGLRLRASRDEEIAARAVGVGVFGQRWVAFVVSAFFTGIGGALYVQSVGAITADALYFQYTFLIIAMLVVGGIGSLAGAVGGALLVSAVAEVLGRLEEGEAVGPLTFSLRPGLRDVVLAAVLILVLLLRPAGLIGGREIGPIRRPKRLVTPEPPPLPEPTSASATESRADVDGASTSRAGRGAELTTGDRRMRIGLGMNSHGLLTRDETDAMMHSISVEEMRPLEFARRAEELGYHSVWIPITCSSRPTRPETRRIRRTTPASARTRRGPRCSTTERSWGPCSGRPAGSRSRPRCSSPPTGIR